MAVFVFGIMIGNKDAFGFAMEEGEQEKLNDFVLTTALIMRMFIFILLGTQVDFVLMNKYLFGGIAVVAVFMLVARPVTVSCALCRTDARNGRSRNCCSRAGRVRRESYQERWRACSWGWAHRKRS